MVVYVYDAEVVVESQDEGNARQVTDQTSISGFVKASQAGRYVGILDEENRLVLLDIEMTNFEANSLEK